MSRDWALRKATEMLKNEVSDGSTVQIDWKERRITVAGMCAFVQEQGSLGGIFQGSHRHLHLP
eukprot:7362546-Alexandrium_andersonii.AAC.1